MKKTVPAIISINEALKDDQDEVMNHYKRKGAVVTPADEEALHMFFSPTRVPKGMTRDEVREVIELYPLVKSAKNFLLERHEWRAREELKKIVRTSKKAKKALKKMYGSVPTAIELRPKIVALDMSAQSHLPTELLPHKEMTRRRFRLGINKLKRALEKFQNAA